MAFPLYPFAGGSQGSTPVTTGVSALFSGADQSYLTFTPSVTSDNKTMTFACWVRRGNTAINDPTPILTPILQANNGNTFIGFDDVSQNGDCLYIITPGVTKYEPIDVFRDTTGWLHLCVQFDTTQVNPLNRIKTWINGIPSSSSYYFQNYPAQNAALDFNTAGVPNYIGNNTSTNTFFDGYLTDIYMLDGIAATPSSFTTGTGSSCRPIAYTGSVGTNGYHLTMSDGANLGLDSSGRGNNWTPFNFISTDSQTESVSSAYNSMHVYNTEIPFNPTSFVNALQTTSINHFRSAATNMSVGSGKWYMEVDTGMSADKMVGICSDTYSLVGFPGNVQGPGTAAFPLAWMYRSNGTKNSAGVALSYGAAWGVNDIVGIAIDMDNGAVYFSLNGVWQGGGDPSTNTNPAYTFSTTNFSVVACLFTITNITGDAISLNFGSPAGGLVYAPPTGYKIMLTSNLPTPTITSPQNYAAPFTYTGTGSTLNISSLNFQPDVVFTRLRTGSSGTPIAIYDSVRGVGNYLDTSLTNGQVTDAQSLTAFTSNGFTLGNSVASNSPGGNYMGFALKSNPANGFVAFQYTGDGTTNRNISHTLGVMPDLMWVKRIDSTGAWYGYFSAFPSQTSYYQPNNSALAVSTSNSPWGSGGITSSYFSVSGNATNNLNVNGATYIVYMWANTPGLFNIGSYSGNGQPAGRLVFTKLRPSWVYTVGGSTMVDAIYDEARNPYNPVNYVSYFSSSADELSSTSNIDIYAMGFDMRHTGARSNTSATYYYMTFGNSPYNTTTAR